jgi:hypothetical protein
VAAVLGLETNLKLETKRPKEPEPRDLKKGPKGV